jgi:hypothetical protein
MLTTSTGNLPLARPAGFRFEAAAEQKSAARAGSQFDSLSFPGAPGERYDWCVGHRVHNKVSLSEGVSCPSLSYK